MPNNEAMKKISGIRIWPWLGSLAVLLMACSNLAARQLDTSDLNEFALVMDRYKADLNYPGITHRTTLSTLGIDWFEYFNPHFHAGLEAGYLELSQASNPVISAQSSDGRYLGLILRFLPFQFERLSLQLDLGYRYYESVRQLTGQESNYTWYQTSLSAQLNLRLSETLQLALAQDYAEVDGEQQDTGTITQTVLFDAEHTSQRLGLDIQVDSNGHIGLEWQGGDRSGGRLYFRRKF